MNTRSIIALVVLLLCGTLAPAQNTTDEQLAAQYFQNKEYDKAVVYYEKLYNKKNAEIYYTYYISCLLELKDYAKAEKVVKKAFKQDNYVLKYLVDLGYVYLASGDRGKAEKEFDEAIRQIKDNQQVFDVAKALIGIKEYDYAITAYLKGRKLSREGYPFNFEIASVYNLKGQTTEMVDELLDALLLSDSYIESVQNALQPSFATEADLKKDEIIKSELLKAIQKHQDKPVFSELLIWMLMQQREFDAAFTQAKALDKRQKEDGQRIMNLAQVCASNEVYDVAAKCYQYVISKGRDGYFYVNARMELLNVLYKKITSKKDYVSADLLQLEKDYQATLDELGRYSGTANIMKDLAHLQAFYLSKIEDARSLLDEAINLPGISETIQAECKLEKADIELMTGDVWEASLLYSQVEKAFKNDPIGHEAKFRNAKLSYYIGDFSWAQAQLNVLKGATTKLIANDAMDLSLKISDNLATDTNPVPLQMFARADLLEFRNRDSAALLVLDSINKQFPGHSLNDDILYKRYEIKLKQFRYTDAAAYLNTIVQEYNSDLLGDDATFKLAELYETRLNDKEKAKQLYEDLLTKHPDSLFTVEARKRYRRLRGDNVN
jgi:tetratricopeptide (TPR) repeat protein